MKGSLSEHVGEGGWFGVSALVPLARRFVKLPRAGTPICALHMTTTHTCHAFVQIIKRCHFWVGELQMMPLRHPWAPEPGLMGGFPQPADPGAPCAAQTAHSPPHVPKGGLILTTLLTQKP